MRVLSRITSTIPSEASPSPRRGALSTTTAWAEPVGAPALDSQIVNLTALPQGGAHVVQAPGEALAFELLQPFAEGLPGGQPAEGLDGAVGGGDSEIPVNGDDGVTHTPEDGIQVAAVPPVFHGKGAIFAGHPPKAQRRGGDLANPLLSCGPEDMIENADKTVMGLMDRPPVPNGVADEDHRRFGHLPPSATGAASPSLERARRASAKTRSHPPLGEIIGTGVELRRLVDGVRHPGENGSEGGSHRFLTVNDHDSGHVRLFLALPVRGMWSGGGA